MCRWILGLAICFLATPTVLAARIASRKPANDCEQRVQRLQYDVKKNLDSLWSDIDNSVGVEFFMFVLKEQDRMPATELSQVEYYRKLLRGMQKTSRELAGRGFKLNPKRVEKLESLLKQMESSGCEQVVSI